MKNLYSYFRLLASPNVIKNHMEKNAQSLRATIYKKLHFCCLEVSQIRPRVRCQKQTVRILLKNASIDKMYKSHKGKHL